MQPILDIRIDSNFPNIGLKTLFKALSWWRFYLMKQAEYFPKSTENF